MRKKIILLALLCVLLTGCSNPAQEFQNNILESNKQEIFVLNEYYNTPIILKTQTQKAAYERYLFQQDDVLSITNNEGHNAILLYKDGKTFVDLDGQLFYTDTTIQPKDSVENLDIHLNEKELILSNDDVVTIGDKNKNYDLIFDNDKLVGFENETTKITIEEVQQKEFNINEEDYEYLTNAELLVKIDEYIYNNDI